MTSHYGSFVMQDTVKEYIEVSHDQLPKLMEFFHHLLTGSGPSVIFSHCEVREDDTVHMPNNMHTGIVTRQKSPVKWHTYVGLSHIHAQLLT